MPKRLIYIPIEPYQARSTEYMSVEGGVYETCFEELGVPFVTLRPDPALHTFSKEIRSGLVLDAVQRASWGFQQTEQLLGMISNGWCNPEEDVIYIEDFWHPGFEMIPYAQSMLLGYDQAKHVPVYSFCHAQSTDPYDFTYPMRGWIRDMERGWAKYQSAIICACLEMVEQWNLGGLPAAKLRPCGLAFNAKAVLRIANMTYCTQSEVQGRDKVVVFSSRWDTEKNPDFFMSLIHKVLRHRTDVRFIICTGHKKLKSNDPGLLEALDRLIESERGRVFLIEGLSKSGYYRVLREAKVQFNCADQDFVSYTLLDAAVNGCAPLYPRHLTFPDALNNSKLNLYCPSDLDDAASKLFVLLDTPLEDYSWVWQKYETSVARMLQAMGWEFRLRDAQGKEWPVPQIAFLNTLTVDQLRAYFSSMEKL